MPHFKIGIITCIWIWLLAATNVRSHQYRNTLHAFAICVKINCSVASCPTCPSAEACSAFVQSKLDVRCFHVQVSSTWRRQHAKSQNRESNTSAIVCFNPKLTINVVQCIHIVLHLLSHSLPRESIINALQIVVEQNMLFYCCDVGSLGTNEWEKPFYARNETITNVPSTKSSVKAQRRCGMLGTWYANIGTNAIFKMPTVGGHAFRRNLAQSHVKSEVQFEMAKVQSVHGVRKCNSTHWKWERKLMHELSLAQCRHNNRSALVSFGLRRGQCKWEQKKTNIVWAKHEQQTHIMLCTNEIVKFYILRRAESFLAHSFNCMMPIAPLQYQGCVDGAQNAKYCLCMYRTPNWHKNKLVRNHCRRTSLGWRLR